MIISLRSDGTATMLEPSHVYQGSNIVNVYVIAPFPNTTALQVGFTLPNGTTASAPMTYVQDSENNLVVWQYTIAAAITNEAGAASISITATTQTGQVIASQSIPFTIEATTLPVLPDTPSQDEYTLVLQYLQQNSAKIATVQGQISTIEEDVATANDKASEALETANQAASAAASNATGIANIVNGTTPVAKADSANTATSAGNATNDGNGANIANTYATKTELSTGNADTLAAAQNYTNQALSNYSIIEIVQTLPETGDTGKIYLVPKADSTSGDLYSEYLWNGSAWELIGTVSATSGTTIKVNGVSQIEVDFTSDPQTQITANATPISNIVDGTTTVPNATKATQDGKGNVIATTYATVTALGSETSARQSADTTLQNNINAIVNGTTPAGDSDKLRGVDAASYAQKIGIYKDLIAGGNTIVDTRAVNSPPSYYADKETCCEFKSRDTLGLKDYMPHSSYVTLTTKKGWEGSYVVYQEAVSAGDDQNSVTDSIKCFRYGKGETWGKWKVILAVDPTTLTPSTENGWSEGGGTLIPPSAGKYFISAVIGSYSTMGEVIYNGTTGYGYLVINDSTVTTSALSSVYINSSGTYITASNTTSATQPDTVYYKKQ